MAPRKDFREFRTDFNEMLNQDGKDQKQLGRDIGIHYQTVNRVLGGGRPHLLSKVLEGAAEHGYFRSTERLYTLLAKLPSGVVSGELKRSLTNKVLIAQGKSISEQITDEDEEPTYSVRQSHLILLTERATSIYHIKVAQGTPNFLQVQREELAKCDPEKDAQVIEYIIAQMNGDQRN